MGDTCPSSHPFPIIDTKECVTRCGSLYHFNNSCYSTCPSGTIPDKDSLNCQNALSNITLSSNSSEIIEYVTNIPPETFIENVNDASQLLISKSPPNSVTVIKTDDMSFSLYPTSIKKEKIQQSNSPVIELGDCENLLRDFYNISKDEQLYIGVVMFNNKNYQYNKTRYIVYDSSGKELDLTVCDDVPIRETKKLNVDFEGLNYQLAKTLAANSGINIYNASEPVFNDRCIPLQCNGKDTTLTDRKNKIQSKASLCEENCNLLDVNFTTNEIQCECPPQKGKMTFNSFVANNEIYNQFTEIFTSTNIYLFKCYKTMKEIKNITKNYGALMSVIVITLEISLFLILFLCQLTPMYIKVAKKIRLNPPKTQASIPLNLSSEGDNNFPSVKVTTNNNFIFSKDYIKNDIQLPPPDEKPVEEMDQEELNSLEFDDAKEQDRRSFGRYYLNIMAEKQIILSPIFYHSIFQPFSLRLIMFIFCLHIFFFLNALFFTEEYISKRYDSNEKLNIIYIIQYELKKSILASITGIVIQKLFSLLTTKTSAFYQIVRDNKDDTTKFKINSLIKKTKLKIIILFVLIFVFTSLFLYFLNTFCYIFKNNQISWIESTLLSVAGNILIYILLCLIISILRFSALKWDKS